MQINVELNELLKAIDNTFDDEVNAIGKCIINVGAYNSEIFEKIGPKVVGSSIEDKFGTNQPGIYIFRIKTQNPIRVPNFNEVNNAPRINKKTRKKRNDYFHDKEILYLGKSESNVSERLSEHIFGPSSDSTYALKLNDENRNALLGNVEVFVFELKSKYQVYTKTILSAVESKLHDKLLPKVGSKR